MEGIKEKGLLEKTSGKLRVALLYPGSYKGAAAALGFIVVHDLFNSVDEVVAHRFTLDSPFSLETGHSIRTYDVIVASVPYEPMLFSLVRTLRRWKVENKPLILGGPGVWNPLPASKIADAIMVGDGEEGIPKLAEALLSSPKPEDWEDVPGLFVPKLKNRVRFLRHDLSYRPPAYVPEKSALGDYPLMVEVSRGCNFGCRFCLIGWTERPRRDRRLSQILSWIAEGLENGARKIYFYGSDILGHPHIKEILHLLNEFNIPFSLSSLRIDKLDEEVMAALRKGGAQSITLAPETFLPGLEHFTNKGITLEQVVEIAKKARNLGFRHVKLYFMIFGFEGEVEAIIEGLRRIRKILPVKASVNFFIPKPYTPFQYLPSPDLEYMRKVSKVLRREGINVMHPARAWVQAILSVGDERAGEFILKGAANTAPARLLKLARELNLDPNDRSYKWMDYVETGVRKDFLEAELERARARVKTPACHEQCTLCGICF